MTLRTAIVDRGIDPATLVRDVSSPSHGAVVLFLGTVRDINGGKPVSGIDYSSYQAMAIAELQRIGAEATGQFQGLALVVEHRVGTLEVGEVSVGIATGHAHRAAAYDANRFVIEELKRRLPVWKREHYTDGTREWVGPDNLVRPEAAQAS
jgi:molybdopterin synthase catalytic subunit